MNLRTARQQKGLTVAALGAMALTVVVAAIIISMGSSILTELQGQQVENSTAWNATGKGLTGMITFANWIPMIALVVVAAIVIGVIVTYLGKAGGGA